MILLMCLAFVAGVVTGGILFGRSEGMAEHE